MKFIYHQNNPSVRCCPFHAPIVGIIRTQPECYYVCDVLKTSKNYELVFRNLDSMTKDVDKYEVAQFFLDKIHKQEPLAKVDIK